MRRGGAEQVVRCFHQAFPDAPIYTMAYRAAHTYPDFQSCKINTSWYNGIAKNEKTLRRFFFPLGVLAMQQLKVEGFDVVLISSTYVAKYVKISPGTLVINYCHTPFRLVWYPESYTQYTQAGFLKKIAYGLVINILKKIDSKAAQKTDYYIANTNEVKERIKSIYGSRNEVSVIKPPVNCKKFHISEGEKTHYLVVSRLESYKKIDLIIEAFNTLGYPLIIVGKGSMESQLKKKAASNIAFYNALGSAELAELYANCKALLFPQKEDYGITPLEANAAGRPVIAYGKGGVLDTMIPYTGDALKATAFFFYEQSKEALLKAIKEFETLTFSADFIRSNAEKFDECSFISKIKDFVADKIAVSSLEEEEKIKIKSA